VDESREAALKIAGLPFHHSNQGPDHAYGCSRLSDKGPVHANGHCCNSTNGCPVDSNPLTRGNRPNLAVITVLIQWLTPNPKRFLQVSAERYSHEELVLL
jgi:hypothetical protein